MHKVRRLSPKTDMARNKRFDKAADKLWMRKMSKICRDGGYAFSECAFALSVHELYGWGQQRTMDVISEACEIWGGYSKDDELDSLINAAQEGVNVLETTHQFHPERPADMDKVTAENFRIATDDTHIMFACIALALRKRGFGEQRLNKVINHAWKWWMKCLENDNITRIFSMCEEELGWRIDPVGLDKYKERAVAGGIRC